MKSNNDKYTELIHKINNFKESINISDYILSTSNEYYIVKKRSTRTNHVLRKNDKDGNAIEIISCWKRRTNGPNGHYMYANKLTSNDAGSIIEWVKSRHHESNLSRVVEIIDNYTNNPINKSESQYYQKKYSGLPALEITDKTPLEQKIQFFGIVPLTNREFLYHRKIDDNTIDSLKFKERIFNQLKVINGIKHLNTAFPIFNITGDLVGIETKNIDYSRTAASSMKGTGLWMSAFESTSRPYNLSLFESCIDALSYHQIKGLSTDNIYLASNGPWNDNLIEITQAIINKTRPKFILLGNDNDLQGYKYNIHLAGQLCRPKEFLLNHVTTPLHKNGIITNDNNLIIKCFNDGNYKVKLIIELSYENMENGKNLARKIKDQFEALVKDSAEDNPFEVKINTLGINNAQIQVGFPNTIIDLAKTLKLVLTIRNMKDYIRLITPKNKDWNDDLMNKSNPSPKTIDNEDNNKVDDTLIAVEEENNGVAEIDAINENQDSAPETHNTYQTSYDDMDKEIMRKMHKQNTDN